MTLQFSVIATPLVVTLAVLAASLLNQPFPGNAALRVGMLIPWALPASGRGSGCVRRWSEASSSRVQSLPPTAIECVTGTNWCR